MPEYLTPGVYFELTDRAATAIAPLRTDIAAFVGISGRGPVDTPVGVNSYEQFKSVFGDFAPNGYLAYAANAFFENGGRRMHAVRVAAPAKATDTDSAIVQPVDRMSNVALDVTGFIAGAAVTVSQDGVAAKTVLLDHANSLTRELFWRKPLPAQFTINDALRPIHFETGVGAASVDLLDANGKPTVRVTASSPGAWGNTIVVRVGHAFSAGTRTIGAQPASGESSTVESVTGFERGSLVRLHQSGAPLASRVVADVNYGDRQLLWKTPIVPALNPALPISLEAVAFQLSAHENGSLREVIGGLSLVAEHSRYIATVFANPSAARYIAASDLSSPSPAGENMPAQTFIPLEGGRDGIAGLTVADFIGSRATDDRRGLRTLELVDEVAIVAMPDILIEPAPPVQFVPPSEEPDPCSPCPPEFGNAPRVDPPIVEQPPKFALEQIFAAQQALVEHCEILRDRFAVLDTPRFRTAGVSTSFSDIQSWRLRFDSKFAALYFPWIEVFDPYPGRREPLRAIPPSGHVAGIYARVDLSAGVHKAPANEELRWSHALTEDISAELQGILNPLHVNCLRRLPGRGLRVYGARTLSFDTLWRFVPVRRLLSMIEEALEESLAWAVFEPNDSRLRKTIAHCIGELLNTLFEGGALAGHRRDDAFFIRSGDDLNPPDRLDRGELLIEVGVAPAQPAEFVILRVGRTRDELVVSE